ncbi:hypothetical protein MXD59_12725 [Frankia sp. Ag45/Mut15]|uniref:Uncharacterized protein n=1 Tax=Frankia umida TaxID=573489 RepID=A0ABT0JYL0_9ACTN|nr:hypothetical protein [Frankia umida]MCK9876632.1 hypothetical protein [Frankia umida]
MTITDADRAALAEQTTANVTGRIRAAQQHAEARRAHFAARRTARAYGNAQRHRIKLQRLGRAAEQNSRAPPVEYQPQPDPTTPTTTNGTP